MKEYGELMDDMYQRADDLGKDQLDTAWLDLDGVAWPNPHYEGPSVPHPEAPHVFHPPLNC